MKTCPPPPRSSAIGPLATMSHVERSVICRHCQKVHNPGFIWNFSDKVRVCFTCYRVMREEGRKSYERQAAREESKKPVVKTAGPKRVGYARKMVGVLALLIAVLGTAVYFFCKPLPEGELAASRGPSEKAVAFEVAKGQARRSGGSEISSL